MNKKNITIIMIKQTIICRYSLRILIIIPSKGYALLGIVYCNLITEFKRRNARKQLIK